jgi:hypothetical protein
MDWREQTGYRGGPLRKALWWGGYVVLALFGLAGCICNSL